MRDEPKELLARLPMLSPLDELHWRKKNARPRAMNRAERRAWWSEQCRAWRPKRKKL